MKTTDKAKRAPTPPLSFEVVEEAPLGFPVGCNWKVPRLVVLETTAEDGEAEAVIGSVVGRAVVVGATETVGVIVGTTELGWIEAEGAAVAGGPVGLTAPPPQSPKPAWQPAPQYCSSGPQKPYNVSKQKEGIEGQGEYLSYN